MEDWKTVSCIVDQENVVGIGMYPLAGCQLMSDDSVLDRERAILYFSKHGKYLAM